MRSLRNWLFLIVRMLVAGAGIWILVWWFNEEVVEERIAGSEWYESQFLSPLQNRCKEIPAFRQFDTRRDFLIGLSGFMRTENNADEFYRMLRQFSCASGLGLEPFFAVSTPDSITDLRRKGRETAILKGDKVPDEGPWMSETEKQNWKRFFMLWENSELSKDSLLPWTNRLGFMMGPGGMSSDKDPAFWKQMEEWMNAKCACRGGYMPKERRRALRRTLSDFRRPMNLFKRTQDWYDLRVFWFHGNTSGRPDAVIVKRGSDIEIAKKLKDKIMQIPYVPTEGESPDCMFLYRDISINLGDWGWVIQ